MRSPLPHLSRERAPMSICAIVFSVSLVFPAISGAGSATEMPPQSAVISLTQVPASRVAAILRRVFTHAHVVVEDHANALIVSGKQTDIDAMRTVASGLDAKNPLSLSTSVVSVSHISVRKAATLIAGIFPSARVQVATKASLVVRAKPEEMTQIQSLISSVDVAPPTPAEAPRSVEVVRLDEAPARDVARQVASTVHGLSIKVSGANIILSGPPDAVGQAKTLVLSLDHPRAQARYSALYRPRSYDVPAVVELLQRTFPTVTFTSEPAVGVFTAIATAQEQHRIQDALTALDANTGTGTTPTVSPDTNLVIYDLKAAVPGANGNTSTTATELSTTVLQALSPALPDLRITAVPDAPRLIIAGSQRSIDAAQSLLNKLDVLGDLIVLDTQIFEIDMSSATDLGLSLPTPVVSTTFTEVTPPASASGAAATFSGLQPFGRTPLSLPMQLNLLVQKGSGRVLANPKITTISGRTATIRAGDTLSVQTTAGGGAGTVATTQLQTFQTGVTLDITPVLNADNNVTVTLHPTVNDVASYVNSIPQIQTRDTTTTVSLHEDQTLVIGGLIQESKTKNTNRVPVLGELPLVGSIFRETQTNYTRSELVVTVTPHIVHNTAAHAAVTPNVIVIPGKAQGAFVSPNALLQTPPPATPVPAAPVNTQPAAPNPNPNPTPSALVNVNTFTYGTPPQNNFAQAESPVQIFYASMSPTVVSKDAPIHLHVVTTTNTDMLSISSARGGQYNLGMTAPGIWEGTFALSQLSNALPFSPANMTLQLTGSHESRASTNITIPVSIL